MYEHESLNHRDVDDSFDNALMRIRLNGLLHLIDDALAAEDYSSFITRSTLTLTRLFNANLTSLHLLSPDKTEFIEQTHTSELTPSNSLDFERFPRETGRTTQMFTTTQLIQMDFSNPHPDDVLPSDMRKYYRNGVSVPLFMENEVFGFFTLLYDQNICWSRRDLDFMLAIGHMLGIIFKRIYSDQLMVLHAGDLRECRLLSQEIKEELSAILALTKAERPSTLIDPDDAEPFESGDSFRPTPREKQLLAYVANGLSNKEIGEMLYISESTVKKQLMQIMKKTGLRNRAHMAAFAVREGFAS